MLGAIAGDIVGSVYEDRPIKTKSFPLFSPDSRFTDDTVLTVAVAEHLLHGQPLVELFHDYVARYPDAGYGKSFLQWAAGRSREPYGSWGNGAAMRVSPVGFACGTLEETLERARDTARVTHNHPEAIRGAQATAAAVFLARRGKTKEAIREAITRLFGYDLTSSLETLRPGFVWDASCPGTVPPALTAFLESRDFEDALRNAVSLGGDSDTLACIAGGVAQAFYGQVPEDIARETLSRLDRRLRQVTEEFGERYDCR